jgi:hypothetical protein
MRLFPSIFYSHLRPPVVVALGPSRLPFCGISPRMLPFGPWRSWPFFSMTSCINCYARVCCCARAISRNLTSRPPIHPHLSLPLSRRRRLPQPCCRALRFALVLFSHPYFSTFSQSLLSSPAAPQLCCRALQLRPVLIRTVVLLPMRHCHPPPCCRVCQLRPSLSGSLAFRRPRAAPEIPFLCHYAYLSLAYCSKNSRTALFISSFWNLALSRRCLCSPCGTPGPLP